MAIHRFTKPGKIFVRNLMMTLTISVEMVPLGVESNQALVKRNKARAFGGKLYVSEKQL